MLRVCVLIVLNDRCSSPAISRCESSERRSRRTDSSASLRASVPPLVRLGRAGGANPARRSRPGEQLVQDAGILTPGDGRARLLVDPRRLVVAAEPLADAGQGEQRVRDLDRGDARGARARSHAKGRGPRPRDRRSAASSCPRTASDRELAQCSASSCSSARAIASAARALALAVSPALVFDRGETAAGVHRGEVVAVGPGDPNRLGQRLARVPRSAMPVQRQAEHRAADGPPRRGGPAPFELERAATGGDRCATLPLM